MPVNTISAAAHVIPTTIKTLYKHYRRKASKFADGNEEEEVTDDVLFDEAFHIVKSFIELGTHNTVESLQAFTNTHVPSPPWAAVSPVLIPFKTCNKAADMLIQWFSDLAELRKVVGGKKWWQVRGLDGIEGEWVTERTFLGDENAAEILKQKEQEQGRPLLDDEADIVRMEDLETVMLYIHGGAYFWGSINTHRYQISKYARKIRGRVFAVNYRKAPQYPWPCAVLDCLAAYLYRVNPPPTAFHKAVPPEKIVVAGDSAGGGLCLTLLTILRDLGNPLPAGGVLISPWVDLTHSFPSVMENTKTDIIPPYGFIHKPSMVWPVDARPGREGRITPADSPPPPKPGHADTLLPSEIRINQDNRERFSDGRTKPVITQKEMLDIGGDARDVNDSVHVDAKQSDKELGQSWYPRPPKVLMDDPNVVPLELRSQIQLYATNEQLTHPLVSPVLQGSLGNLCPLYIIAGNNECLRDEIIYLAHRAAYPEEFPPREEEIGESCRQAGNVKKFRTPTKVHLQVFDGMCHVPTVFTFHKSIKYAYRSIAEFVKHVTTDQVNVKAVGSFPELAKNDKGVSESLDTPDTEQSLPVSPRINNGLKSLLSPLSSGSGDRSSTRLFDANKAATKEHIQEYPLLNKLAPGGENVRAHSACKNENSDTFPSVVMIRERVNIHGSVRQMEDKADIPCLRLKADDIGLLREAPARRWLTGQQKWDGHFKDVAEKVEKRRKRVINHYERALARAHALGLVHTPFPDDVSITTDSSVDENNDNGQVQRNRRWAPLDLDDEEPPPSAIVGRKDTLESMALLKKTLYHTAPRTIKKMPKRKMKDVVQAALDPSDNLSRSPRQSVSEEQRVAEIVPVHGLSLWASIMTYFAKRTSSQAAKGKEKAVSGMKKFKVGFRRRDKRSRTGSMKTERSCSSNGVQH